MVCSCESLGYLIKFCATSTVFKLYSDSHLVSSLLRSMHCTMKTALMPHEIYSNNML